MSEHNFNAGPSILPREVLEDTATAILDFNGSGLSPVSYTHLILSPMIVPVYCPLWILAVATAFSVIFAKEVFGGTGSCN